MSSKFTPFPSLFPESVDPWHWPSPPFAWHHKGDAGEEILRCRIEAKNGDALEGELVSIDPPTGILEFRRGPGAKVHSLSFSRFCRLTLLNPLEEAPRRPGDPSEKLPTVTHQRSYRVQIKGSDVVLEGLTVGHVENSEGLFLFTPMEGGHALLRVLVPREAYTGLELGRSSEELVADRWVATREDLLQALADQARKPVIQVGQALVELGLVTEEQLQRVLAGPSLDLPLGERLVALGLVGRADLQTALAYKMGYPLVDLTRFPLDSELAQSLPFNLAVQARSVPLMLDGNRLIIAMDRPARLELLKGLQAAKGLSFVPVLASKQQLLAALSVLNPLDVWSANEFGLPGYAATTS